MMYYTYMDILSYESGCDAAGDTQWTGNREQLRRKTEKAVGKQNINNLLPLLPWWIAFSAVAYLGKNNSVTLEWTEYTYTRTCVHFYM